MFSSKSKDLPAAPQPAPAVSQPPKRGHAAPSIISADSDDPGQHQLDG